MKTGKVIFNLDESFPEYIEKNKNGHNLFDEKFQKFTLSSTVEDKKDEDPFKKEYLNSLLKNEEDILEKNEELTSGCEENQDNLQEMGKIFY